MPDYRYVAVVVCAGLCVVLGETSLRFRARFNAKLKEDQVNKSITTDGLMMCMALCKAEKSFLCETASWGEGKCLLSQRVKIHERKDNLDTDGNWITMCRIVYPVFLAVGDGGLLSLTFEEGSARCQRSGSKIASREDLLQAGAMGFKLCDCGWLADGSAGFVRHAGGNVSEEIISCEYEIQKYNVDCKV